jgi:hypothetical protein
MSLVQTIAWLLDGDLPWSKLSHTMDGDSADENLALARQKAKQLPELFGDPSHAHFKQFAYMVFTLTFDERPDYEAMRAVLRPAPQVKSANAS